MTAVAWTKNQKDYNVAKQSLRSCGDSFQKTRLTRGNTVRVTDDYSLYDVNINGTTGIYVKKTTTAKILIYVPTVDEWAELKEGQFEIVPGPIPKDNLEFVSRIKTMIYTLFQ